MPRENPFHPELRLAARLMPKVRPTRTFLAVMRRVMRFLPTPRLPAGVQVKEERVPGPPGAPPVRVRVYTPQSLQRPAPAFLWIHGGGYVMGTPEQDEALCAANAADLGAIVVSVDYRLAPEHPFPAPLEDCYAALRWTFESADTLGISRDRIAIGGASAGGGLAAALAQLAHDRGEVAPVFQVLVYPMLDDRTAARTDIDGRNHRAWVHESNVLGWTAYLGHAPGRAEVAAPSVPARRESLSGLPPAWLGVGTCDLFHDEDLEYARRLNEQGVPCELITVPGAFHGFDAVARKAQVSRDFRASYLSALRRALHPAKTG